MNIGNAIKTLRHQKRIKQKSFAEMCGISATYLSLIESNTKEPTITTLKIIAENLGVPIPVLFFMSFDENDIIPEKREAYKFLEPSLKSMISELFIKKV